MNNTLKTIRDLSDNAKNLFTRILSEGDLARKSDFDTQEGWEELVEEDLLNCWADDTETEFCEIGNQA